MILLRFYETITIYKIMPRTSRYFKYLSSYLSLNGEKLPHTHIYKLKLKRVGELLLFLLIIHFRKFVKY